MTSLWQVLRLLLGAVPCLFVRRAPRLQAVVTALSFSIVKHETLIRILTSVTVVCPTERSITISSSPYTTSNAYTDSTDDEFNAIPTVQVAGITSWNVTGMSASSEAGNGKMTVKWTDPSASISADGVTLASWASTTIVVKSGSYPTSKDDSGAVYTLKVTTRNRYSSTPLTITGLTNGTKYYIAFFPETTDGGINTSTSQRTTGTANRITIANVPAQSGTLTYNKSSQSPSWSNYNTTYMTIGGTTSGTNAGNYTASFTPKTDYRWSDGATTAKNGITLYGSGKYTDPYDDGFTAYVNGEQADIVEVDEGLMAVLCPAGTNRVDFVYQADGYSLSRTVTLAAIPVFAVYCGFWWDRKKRKTA